MKALLSYLAKTFELTDCGLIIRVCLSRKICAMLKEVKTSLSTVSTFELKVYGIPKSLLK